MRSKRFVVMMAIVLLIPMRIASQSKTDTGCKSESFAISHLEQVGKGWDIDFADRSQVLGMGPYMDFGKETPYSSVVYAPKKKVLELPWLQVSRCDDSATLSYLYVLPLDVRQISKGNRVFAYRVYGDLMRGPQLDSGGVGGSGAFMFYDIHGTGRFDGLEILVASKPLLIPEWVKQLPPN